MPVRSQIKSLIFSLYSAKFVRDVCGAYKAGSKFKKLISKFDFQKLNKILINHVHFFDCIIIFQSTKMLAQIAYLPVGAFMSLPPYVLATLCLCDLMSLRPYVCALMSCALLSAPLCRVSISLSRKNFLFGKFLMTSLHVIACDL